MLCQGLRCVGMSAEEAARWEAESNPWGEGAAANELLDMFAKQMALHPDVKVCACFLCTSSHRHRTLHLHLLAPAYHHLAPPCTAPLPHLHLASLHVRTCTPATKEAAACASITMPCTLPEEHDATSHAHVGHRLVDPRPDRSRIGAAGRS